MRIERLVPPFARETIAGATLLAASTGFACANESQQPAVTGNFLPTATAELPTFTPTATPTPTETPTPTPVPLTELPLLFKPTTISVDSIPSFSNGVAISQAELVDGEWKDPGLGLVQHEAFPNQTVMWGHSRWQGITQLSGYFMLEGNVGDEVTIGAVNQVEKLTGPQEANPGLVEGVSYTITKFMVMDETHISQLYHEDQQLQQPTIFFFTSLRVDRQYDPSRYWVLPQGPIFEKAGENALTDLSDPDKYGYVVAVMEMNEGEECKIINSYGDIEIPGFLTPDEQCR